MEKILKKLIKNNIKHKKEVDSNIQKKQSELKEKWNTWGTPQKIQKR